MDYTFSKHGSVVREIHRGRLLKPMRMACYSLKRYAARMAVATTFIIVAASVAYMFVGIASAFLIN